MLLLTVAQSFSDDSAVCRVFPVMRMTLRCHIMNQTQIQTWSPRRNKLFTVTRQMAPLNCARGGRILTWRAVRVIFRNG